MSVSANKVIYDFYRKLNAQNTGQSKNYKIADAVSYLNEAYEIWFENKVAAADQNQKIKNDLRKFKVKNKKLDCAEVDCNICKIEYPKDFYQRLNLYALACNEECCGDIEKEILITVVQSDDLQVSRRDGVRKSDFKWERLIADDSEKGMYIYHDGEMDIKGVYIDYYRKPLSIQAPELVNCREGYEDWDSKRIKDNVDFEVSSTFANRQVSDIAVLLASRDSSDEKSFTSQLQKILQIDRLYRKI